MSKKDDKPAAKDKPASGDDLKAVEKLNSGYKRIRDEIGRVIVGQDQVCEELLIALFARGHCILEGVPGLAKTLLVSTLAKALSLSFNRIQFTPDLMPSDITGTEIIQENKSTGAREFRFVKGPIFANAVLADEINRTPPKTQAALLEAMQEHTVTAAGNRHVLPEPFFVLATQNPIEQEGTYPLPEAQQDRFLFKIQVRYPTRDEEKKIIGMTGDPFRTELKHILSAEEILELQNIVDRVPVAETVLEYAMDLVRQTRVKEGESPQYIKDWVTWGAGPRASSYMIRAAKARAVLRARYHVSREDVDAVAKPVLRHRIITNYNADSEGVTTDQIVDKLIQTTSARYGVASTEPEAQKAFK